MSPSELFDKGADPRREGPKGGDPRLQGPNRKRFERTAAENKKQANRRQTRKRQK